MQTEEGSDTLVRVGLEALGFEERLRGNGRPRKGARRYIVVEFRFRPQRLSDGEFFVRP